MLHCRSACTSIGRRRWFYGFSQGVFIGYALLTIHCCPAHACLFACLQQLLALPTAPLVKTLRRHRRRTCPLRQKVTFKLKHFLKFQKQ